MNTATPTAATTTPPRVAIVSGSYGAGHDAAAAELAASLSDAGCAVDLYDIALLLPGGAGRVARTAYLAQLRWLPATWSTTLNLLQPGSIWHLLTLAWLATAADRVSEIGNAADLVVSTHPFASQALGVARGDHRLRTPVATYLTDASVHSLWVHHDVDLHLGIHDLATEQARGLGAKATTITPAVSLLLDPRRRLALRNGSDVPARPWALVVGGSLGIGELDRAAHDIAATGVMTPVVVCGRNTRLRRRLERHAGVVALGWREDLPELIDAADCVVQNAGGFTSLQTLAAGTPLLTYLPIPGHGETNASALDRAGLVPWVQPEQLADALLSALVTRRKPKLPTGAPSAIAALSTLVPGVVPARSPVPAAVA